jgi:hypothetical protein
MFDVSSGSRKGIIEAENLCAICQEALAQVGSKKPEPPVTKIRSWRCIQRPKDACG